MTVEHTSWELISWRPGVAESMRSALMGFPKVSILSSDVELHSFSDNYITEVLEFSIVKISGCTELGSNESWSGLFDQLEESHVLDASHFDDFGNTVSDPSLMESFPEVSVCDSKDWRMISTIEVLEAVTITACSW